MISKHFCLSQPSRKVEFTGFTVRRTPNKTFNQTPERAQFPRMCFFEAHYFGNLRAWSDR
ncbi:hypothetical protein CSW58_01740 [Caulobacter sp. B11]|nr:hypothetical protein CSW58_01740 [Caulobacter sp. B11]